MHSECVYVSWRGMKKEKKEKYCCLVELGFELRVHVCSVYNFFSQANSDDSVLGGPELLCFGAHVGPGHGTHTDNGALRGCNSS